MEANTGKVLTAPENIDKLSELYARAEVLTPYVGRLIRPIAENCAMLRWLGESTHAPAPGGLRAGGEVWLAREYKKQATTGITLFLRDQYIAEQTYEVATIKNPDQTEGLVFVSAFTEAHEVVRARGVLAVIDASICRIEEAESNVMTTPIPELSAIDRMLIL